MAARTANALLNTVVNSQGAIEARSLRGRNGRIVLDGGPDGKVMVGGALSANALNGPGHGGTVEVRGQAVEVALGTQVEHARQQWPQRHLEDCRRQDRRARRRCRMASPFMPTPCRGTWRAPISNWFRPRATWTSTAQ